MVEDIIAGLTTVPSEEIGPAMINKLAVPRNTALKDGDILEIFPSIIGG
jgi:molybdopterin converting factor small subunit